MKDGQDRNGSQNHLAFKRDKYGLGLHDITAPARGHLYSTVQGVSKNKRLQGLFFLPINAADYDEIIRNNQRPDIDLERGFKVVLTSTTRGLATVLWVTGT